jgi:hypothetical protein
MLETLVDVCPDEVWYGVYNDIPFWYQVYHVAYFVDYWFRAEGAMSPAFCMSFDPRIPPEFEHDVPADVSISRAEIREYLSRIRVKLDILFAALDDAALARPVFDGIERYTLLDILFGQTRHIMYNVGYCNGILRERNLEESDWYSYNEPIY